MTNTINNWEKFSPSPIDLELLEALLEPEEATYPWNSTTVESEEFFQDVEAQLAMDELLDSELSARSNSFYNQLDTLWNNYNHTTNVGLITSLKENLQMAIASRIPQEWIERIVEKAADIFNSKQSMSEQLMLCAQTVLPSLGADDLLVLARPFAYAMRNAEPQSLESVLNKVGEQEWKNLSEIEQAKVSLAVAYHTIRQLSNHEA
jgi:hypothetical protein